MGKANKILERLMVCTAKHQGNPQEWIEGRCITPTQAKQAIEEIIAQETKKAEMAVIQVILNTCKYQGRELYLSTTAVEQLLEVVKANDDSGKALTAISKQLQESEGGDEKTN